MEVERGLRGGVVMVFGLLVVAVREVSVMAGLLMVTFFVMVLRFEMNAWRPLRGAWRHEHDVRRRFSHVPWRRLLTGANRKIGPRAFMAPSGHAEMPARDGPVSEPA